MMQKIQQILDLVRETGDRLIVMDQEGEPYVLMNLANYRQLLREESHVGHLTEEELLEKINRLVASWKSNQPDLADYDLAQFRVDTIRQTKEVAQPPVYEPVGEPVIDSKAAQQEQLLAQVIDASEEEDEYYPEPTADELPIL